MPTVNATHRKRLARAYAAQAGITYMAALDKVTKAAVAGRLPATLDEAGMQAALRILTSGGTLTPVTVAAAVAEATAPGAPGRKVADDPRDQQIFDLSAAYERLTGKQGLIYISSPGSGQDRYVFGGVGGGHVCLGREEALTYITGLLNTVPIPTDESAPIPDDDTPDCLHADIEYRSHDGTYCVDCGEPLMSYEQLLAADRFHMERSSLALLRQVWQGRVAWERYGTRKPGFRFTIDDTPAPEIRDIELRWLRDNGYFTAAPLAEGEEWSVARTTEWGDDVLAVNGADTDMFHDGLPKGWGGGHMDINEATARARAVEQGKAPSGSVILKVTGPNSLSSPDSAPAQFSTEGTSAATARSLLKVRDTFLSAGRVEWWWHTGPFAGSHGFKFVEGVDEEDGSIVFRDEDPNQIEPVTRLSLDYIDDPDKAARHLIWPDHTGVTFCDKKTGDIDATYKIAPSRAEPLAQQPANVHPLRPGAEAQMDRSADRLMGGPYTTTVRLNGTTRRTTPRCDVCNRKLATGEPWWMVRSPARNWENNAGAVCGMHHPDRLPHETATGSPDPAEVEGHPDLGR